MFTDSFKSLVPLCIKVMAIFILSMGMIVTYVLYDYYEDGKSALLPFFIITTAIISTSIFTYYCVIKNDGMCLIRGVLYSYASYIMLIVFGSLLLGELTSTLTWIVVIVMFLALFMLPQTISCWLAVQLWKKSKERKER